MQFFDISLTIQNSMLVWRGDSPAEVDRFAIVEKDG